MVPNSKIKFTRFYNNNWIRTYGKSVFVEDLLFRPRRFKIKSVVYSRIIYVLFLT